MPVEFLARIVTSESTELNLELPLEITSSSPSQISASVPYGYKYDTNQLWLNSSVFYSSNGRLNVSFHFNTNRYIYYGYNTFQGEYYSENLNGPDIELGDEVSFVFQVGEHTASGSITVSKYGNEQFIEYGPEDYRIYKYNSYNGNGSGQPEL